MKNLENDVLIVAGLHGDELLGFEVYNEYERQFSDIGHVGLLAGNPEAINQGVRFIETDLNRSFGVLDAESYEERRALEIQQEIERISPSLIIDIHQTTATQRPSFIAHRLSPAVKQLLAVSDIDTVVTLPDDIAGGSLIGQHASAVSIEIDRSNESKGQAGKIARSIARYVIGDIGNSTKRIHHIEGAVTQNDNRRINPLELRNFQLSEYGFIPFLAGEESYSRAGFVCFELSAESMMKLGGNQ